MKKISEIFIENYFKSGKINVEFDELKKLFLIIKSNQLILKKMCDYMNDEEVKQLSDSTYYFEYMLNKYLELPELSKEQKKWFVLLKKVDTDEFADGATTEELDKSRRIVWGCYLDAKGKREELRCELEAVKEKRSY